MKERLLHHTAPLRSNPEFFKQPSIRALPGLEPDRTSDRPEAHRHFRIHRQRPPDIDVPVTSTSSESSVMPRMFANMRTDES